MHTHVTQYASVLVSKVRKYVSTSKYMLIDENNIKTCIYALKIICSCIKYSCPLTKSNYNSQIKKH